MKILVSLVIGVVMIGNLSGSPANFNFKDVDLFAFDCEATEVETSISGAEWNRDEAILRVFKDEDQLEYEVKKRFVGKSLIMLGSPIDGTTGSVQFILRNGKASTVVVDAKKSSKLYCQMELL